MSNTQNFELEDLHSLCADRPEKTIEQFGPNCFYGNDFAYKKYYNIEPCVSLSYILPHSPFVYENLNYVWTLELNSSVKEIVCYSNFNVQKYKKALDILNIDKKLTLNAFPFLYVVDMMKSEEKQEKKGTVYFPSHSTHHIMDESDYEKLAVQLESLDPKYHPISVCVYWKDILLNRHLSFTKRGMKVVSAGHIFDPNFLFRLYEICSAHKYASSNRFGSHTMLSIASGCSFFMVNKEDFYQTELNNILYSKLKPSDIDTHLWTAADKIKNIEFLCDLFDNGSIDKQMNWAKEMLGWEFKTQL